MGVLLWERYLCQPSSRRALQQKTTATTHGTLTGLETRSELGHGLIVVLEMAWVDHTGETSFKKSVFSDESRPPQARVARPLPTDWRARSWQQLSRSRVRGPGSGWARLNTYRAHPWSPFPLRRAHPGLGPHTGRESVGADVAETWLASNRRFRSEVSFKMFVHYS